MLNLIYVDILTVTVLENSSNVVAIVEWEPCMPAEQIGSSKYMMRLGLAGFWCGVDLASVTIIYTSGSQKNGNLEMWKRMFTLYLTFQTTDCC